MKGRKAQSNSRKTNGTESSRNEWQLQDAKAHFSELFRLAHEKGPEEYQRLALRQSQPQSRERFFAESPLAGSGIELEARGDYGRDIDLERDF
jgi:hypothetical protein